MFMATIVQRFSEGAYIITADGEEIPVYEGMVLEDGDIIVGDVATIEDVNAVDPGADVTTLPADLAALQQAILEGVDPTQVAEATAAGAGQQGPEDQGGSTFVALDRTKGEIDPYAGYPTGTFPYVLLEPEDEVPFNETIELTDEIDPIINNNPIDDVVIQPIEPILDDEIPEDEEPVDEEPNTEPEVDQPEDDDSDEEDREEESPDSEDEEDETDPETDGPESEDDESDEDESEGEDDQTDEGEEDDSETEDQDDSEDDVDDESEDDSKSGSNNGWGNGDQDAPGNSEDNNNAENSDADVPPGILKKQDLLDEDEDIIPGLDKEHQDNGYGNGDDASPGGSGDNNNAENQDGGDTDGMGYAPGNSGNGITPDNLLDVGPNLDVL